VHLVDQARDGGSEFYEPKLGLGIKVDGDYYVLKKLLLTDFLRQMCWIWLQSFTPSFRP
jgi:hypothetical protein